MRPAQIFSVSLATILSLTSFVAAAGVATVVQKGRAFSESSLRVAPGDVVRFNNDDKFLHQVFVKAASFGFESEEQVPGTSVEIQFSKTGIFEVRCHIHPKMLLTVDAH